MREIRLIAPRIIQYPDDKLAVQLVWLDNLKKPYFSNYSVYWGKDPDRLEQKVCNWSKNKIRIPIKHFKNMSHYYFQVIAEHPEGEGMIFSNSQKKRVIHQPEHHMFDIMRKRTKLFGDKNLF